MRAAILSFLAGTSLLTGAVLAEETRREPPEDVYVILPGERDSNLEALYRNYPEISSDWRKLARRQLLGPNQPLAIPRYFFKDQQVLTKVRSFNGEAELLRAGDQHWSPLVKDLWVRPGDELRTRPRAGAVLVQEDGSTFRFFGGSRVRFEKADDLSGRLTQVTLQEGGFLSKIRKALERDSRFEILTPNSRSLVRGTSLRIKVNSAGATRLEVLEGMVELVAAGGRATIRSSEGAKAESGEAPRPRPLPPAPAALVAPAAREVWNEDIGRLRFSWEPVAGAAFYRVEIARDPDFLDVADEELVARAEDYVARALGPGTYFWRASAVDAEGFEGAPTEPFYFVYPERAR